VAARGGHPSAFQALIFQVQINPDFCARALPERRTLSCAFRFVRRSIMVSAVRICKDETCAMNAPSLNEIRGAGSRDLTDEKMEQVREILVGDSVRRMEQRVAFLEQRQADFEISIGRQLDALEARIEALAGAADGDRRVTFDALATSVAGLSEQIRRISRG
jgi:hypothetical protein